MLHRKNRFRRCSKGVSTVIGTIFLVLIALTVATNVFLWTFTQNATYNQAVKESSQMDADISSERIVAYNTVFLPISQNEVNVTTTITAQGALSAQIIRVWVTWTVDGSDKYGNTTVDFNLTPGDTITRTITVNMNEALVGTGEFNGWLVTARGNRVPLEQKILETIRISEVTLGIGAISMDFTNFKYYNVTDNVLDNYNTTGGGNGYSVIQGGDGIAFQIALTNYDRSNESITLYSPSVFFTLFPSTPTAVHGGMWYIVDVNADGSIDDDFTNITINHGSTVNLFFASAIDVNDVTKPGFTPSPSKYIGIAPANLALFGKIGDHSYGQNIPFVSIYIHNIK